MDLNKKLPKSYIWWNNLTNEERTKHVVKIDKDYEYDTLTIPEVKLCYKNRLK